MANRIAITVTSNAGSSDLTASGWYEARFKQTSALTTEIWCGTNATYNHATNAKVFWNRPFNGLFVTHRFYGLNGDTVFFRNVANAQLIRLSI